jgi:hypothetical protein
MCTLKQTLTLGLFLKKEKGKIARGRKIWGKYFVSLVWNKNKKARKSRDGIQVKRLSSFHAYI